MVGKLRVQKRLYYKIGEACKALGIQPYVLRYWETEFPALAPSKSRSGQRVYSEKELEIIRRIKVLLYEEGYTIAGAKKKLEADLAGGALGEPPPEEVLDHQPEEMSAATAPAAPPRAKVSTGIPPEPRAVSLDTNGIERVQRLRSGIEEALREAREILVLLDSKPR